MPPAASAPSAAPIPSDDDEPPILTSNSKRNNKKTKNQKRQQREDIQTPEEQPPPASAAPRRLIRAKQTSRSTSDYEKSVSQIKENLKEFADKVVQFIESTAELCIYFDGACRGNGRADACASAGVWVAWENGLYIGIKLPFANTNNIAEMTACWMATTRQMQHTLQQKLASSRPSAFGETMPTQLHLPSVKAPMIMSHTNES